MVLMALPNSRFGADRVDTGYNHLIEVSCGRHQFGIDDELLNRTNGYHFYAVFGIQWL